MSDLNGIAPCIFGPPLWMFLHLLSFSYPDYPDEILKKNIFNFFKNLGLVLPCSECKNHYESNFAILNLENSLGSRDLLTKWVYDLHVLVNKQTGKTSWPSYQEVYEKYNKLKKETCGVGVCDPNTDLKCKVEIINKNSENFTESEDNTVSWCIAIIIILVLIIIGLVYQKSYKTTSIKKFSKII